MKNLVKIQDIEYKNYHMLDLNRLPNISFLNIQTDITVILYVEIQCFLIIPHHYRDMQ